LFAAAGAGLARAPVGTRAAYLLSLALVAFVTAILNLDTSVVFLTPVLLHLARVRGVDETPFLYGTVFMSNAASLFLPGSNLTNLIALHGEHASGAAFLGRMWAAAVAAVVVTAIVLAVAYRRELARPATRADDQAPARVGLGLAAVALSTALVLTLSSPALPILGVGIGAVIASRVEPRRIHQIVDARVLALLFALAVGLGAAGRLWHGPASLLGHLGRVGAALGGAVAAVCVNNLPAAVLLTPHAPHPRALLLGLNLGPNLAVTGSLSAYLWLRVARSLGARPSVRAYSSLGLVLVPLSLCGALGALWLAAPGRL
jgi:arsenical pump membrane protein